MTENFRRLQQRFIHNDELLLLSFSVTPWIDSVPRLQLFAKKNNVNPGKWHLLTGNKADIYRIARQSYFAEEEMGITKDSTEFLHTEHFLLVDQTGKLRGIYNGTLALETERLMDDIDLLIRGE
jgi:protein SCO1/2